MVGSIEGEGMVKGVSVAAHAVAGIGASAPTSPNVTILASTFLIPVPLDSLDSLGW
jgi:hypothetical protein